MATLTSGANGTIALFTRRFCGALVLDSVTFGIVATAGMLLARPVS